jgi:hypothetical protein
MRAKARTTYFFLLAFFLAFFFATFFAIGRSPDTGALLSARVTLTRAAKRNHDSHIIGNESTNSSTIRLSTKLFLSSSRPMCPFDTLDRAPRRAFHAHR